MRSNWKLPFISRFFILKNILLQKNIKNFFFVTRAMLIPMTILDLKVKIYNGRRFISNIVRFNMLYHKFGEFCITKSLGSKIHLKKNKKNKKNKKLLKK